MRTRLALCAAAMTLVACGGDSGGDAAQRDRDEAAAREQAVGERAEAARQAEQGVTSPEEAACAAFDGVANSACTLSYDVCSVSTPAAVAQEYGGDPAIPSDVARVYSESYMPAAQPGGAAGCESGFASQDQGG